MTCHASAKCMAKADGESSKELPQSGSEMGVPVWLKYTGMKRTGSAKEKSNASVIWIEVMKKKEAEVEFAVCINNADYPASLELHKIYRVLPDEDAAADGDLRIIDESGEDYLYPADWFVLVKLPQAVEESLMQAA